MRRGATRGRSPRQRSALGEMACPQAVASTFRPGVELLSIRYRDGRKRCVTRAEKQSVGGKLAAGQGFVLPGGLGLCGTDRRILLVKPGFSTLLQPMSAVSRRFCSGSESGAKRLSIWNRCARAWSGASLGWRRSTGSRRATPIYRTVIKLGSRQAPSARFIGPTFGTFIRPIPSISRTRRTNHRKGRRDTHPAAPSFPHCPVRAHPCSRGGRRRPEPPHLLHGAAQWTCSRARLLCLDAAGAAR